MKEVDHWSVGLTEAEREGVKKYQKYINQKQKLNRTIWKARDRRLRRRLRSRIPISMEYKCNAGMPGPCLECRNGFPCTFTPPGSPEPPEKKEEEKKEEPCKDSNP